MVVAIIVLGAVLAIVATLGHPRVRVRPQTPATRPRIAVLPFENRTGSADIELLASDVTHAITEALASSAGDRYEVVPREASLSYKDMGRGVAEVAEALECDYVIAGQIDASEGSILVDLYLYKAGHDPKFWPERREWDRSQTAVIPDEIAGLIQRALVRHEGSQGPGEH